MSFVVECIREAKLWNQRIRKKSKPRDAWQSEAWLDTDGHNQTTFSAFDLKATEKFTKKNSIKQGF